jgi:hypothetical protein
VSARRDERRELVVLLGRLLSTPSVRDGLARAEPALLHHAERVYRTRRDALAEEFRAPQDDLEAAVERLRRMTAITEARLVAAKVAAHPGPVIPRAS